MSRPDNAHLKAALRSELADLTAQFGALDRRLRNVEALLRGLYGESALGGSSPPPPAPAAEPPRKLRPIGSFGGLFSGG
jgi:hypothetical protein